MLHNADIIKTYRLKEHAETGLMCGWSGFPGRLTPGMN